MKTGVALRIGAVRLPTTHSIRSARMNGGFATNNMEVIRNLPINIINYFVRDVRNRVARSLA